MDYQKKTAKHIPLSRYVVCLTALLLSLWSLTAGASDWMLNPDKFSMSNHDDHVSFEIFLADLDRSNTYAERGCICALDEETHKEYYLLDLRYIEEGSDENPNGKVKARVCINEARAWFTNGFPNSEVKITNGSEQEYTLTKWGSKNHYMTAHIDYYYPAELVNKNLKFYYRYDHSNEKEYVMDLGRYWLSSDLGLPSFGITKYECKRIGGDKIKLTLPSLPNNIPSKMADVWSYEGTYKITFTYTLKDNSEKKVVETRSCVVGEEKSYELTIPEDVGYFSKVNVAFEMVSGLKDETNYFWKKTNWVSKNDFFQIVPIPIGLSAEYRQFDEGVYLQWNTYSVSGNQNYTCLPYIYRMETDDKGNVLSGKTWEKRTALNDNVGVQGQSYLDKRRSKTNIISSWW
jgi:hypothetical protein